MIFEANYLSTVKWKLHDSVTNVAAMFPNEKRKSSSPSELKRYCSHSTLCQKDFVKYEIFTHNHQAPKKETIYNTMQPKQLIVLNI